MNILELIRQIEPRAAEFDSAALMHLEITDYKRPIVTDKYMLAAIKPVDNKKLGALRDKHRNIRMADYLFAYNKSSSIMPFGRFAVYLHNCFTDGVLDDYYDDDDDISMILVDMDTAETDNRMSRSWSSGCFSIPLSAFDDLFRLPDPDRPALDDFDIALILRQLQEDGMLYHGGLESDRRWSSFDKSYHSKYADYADFGMFDWPEADMVAEAMRRFQFDDPVQALVTMHHAGQLTRVVDFTADPMVALYFACNDARLPEKPGKPAAVLLLPEADLKSSADLEYPLAEDCVLHCEPTDEYRRRTEAQATVSVFFHDGRFNDKRSERENRAVLIPREATGLLLRHSGRTAADVYPDMASYFSAPQKPLVSEAADKRIRNACEMRRDINFSVAGYVPADHDRICLLDIEIRDRDAVETDGYVIVPSKENDTVFIKCLIKNLSSNIGDELPPVPYIMGCRGDFDWEGFDAELRALKPDLDVKPVMAAFTIDPTADLLKRPLRVGRDRLKLTAAVLDNIVRCYLRT